MHAVSLDCPIRPLGLLLVSIAVFVDGTKLTLEIYIKVFDSLYLSFVSDGILSASQNSKESENSDPVDLNRIYYKKIKWSGWRGIMMMVS